MRLAEFLEFLAADLKTDGVAPGVYETDLAVTGSALKLVQSENRDPAHHLGGSWIYRAALKLYRGKRNDFPTHVATPFRAILERVPRRGGSRAPNSIHSFLEETGDAYGTSAHVAFEGRALLRSMNFANWR